MQFNTHESDDLPIVDLVYGEYLKEVPTLRLLHLRSIQRQLNKLFSVGEGKTVHNLIFACQTSVTPLTIIDVLSKLKEEIADLEWLAWINKFYKTGEQ